MPWRFAAGIEGLLPKAGSFAPSFSRRNRIAVAPIKRNNSRENIG